MEHTEQWTVTVFLDEHDTETHASARLRTGETELTGHGVARRNPRDSDVPEIGDELAVARALSDLANLLFQATVGDLEAFTHQRATVIP